jgi:hypothetical protein
VLLSGFAVSWYCLLALWTTGPLAYNPTRMLAAGPEYLETVPLFNVWTIWWNADRALHGFEGYWNAPIFHPERDAFAFSEPQPMTLLVAPIIWLSGSRVLAYNAYLWLSLVLNAVFAERLLRQLQFVRCAAVCGATLVLLLPVVHWQRDVLQLVPLWAILWSWSMLLSLALRPTLRRGVVLGGACAAIFLISMHQGLMALTLIVACGWVLISGWRNSRLWIASLTAIVVFAGLIGPLAWKMHAVASRYEFTRSVETVAELSARPGDYTAATGRQLFDPGLLWARGQWRLSPGWIKVSLAIGGLIIGLLRHRWRRWTLFLLATCLLAMLLSFGPNLQIANCRPWDTLVTLVPGYAQLRNAFRFAYFVQLAAALLAAQGLYAGLLFRRRHCASGAASICLGSVIVLFALAAIAEVTPDPVMLVKAPDADAHREWLDFLRRETPRGRAIACLPFAAGDHVGDYESTARWMYFGTFHRVPLVNGYSGFFPPTYFEIRDALRTVPLSKHALKVLEQADVEFIVANRHWLPVKTLDDLPSEPEVQHVFSDASGIEIYRLRRITP